MRRQNGLFWGIFLLTLGVLFLARRAGWLDVDWHALVNLWPVLLILAGVNVILERRGSPAAFVTTIMLAVAVPTTLFGFFVGNRHRDEARMGWHYDNDDDEDGDNGNDGEDGDDGDDGDNDSDDNEESYRSEREKRVQTSTFTEPMTDDTREAVLKLSGGAGRFSIGEPTGELIKADTKQSVGSYSMAIDRNPTTRVPTIELKPTEQTQHIDLKDGNFENRVDIALNAKPVWTLDMGLGAGQSELDLSPYTIRNVKIGAGAADIDLKLGDKAEQTDVKLDVGAASVTVRIPKTVGCRIKKDGALNLEQLDDFTSLGKGEFTSPGYETTSKKIMIRFDGGISRFKVVRY